MADTAIIPAGGDEADSVASLLSAYYAHSYRRLLGVDLSERQLLDPLHVIARALRDPAPTSQLDVPRVSGMGEVRRRADRYRRWAGPVQRLRALRGLIGRLGNLRDADLRLVELGSDDGSLLDLIFGQGRKRFLVGVDPAMGPERSWTRQQGAARIVRSLEEAHAVVEHFGMAWASFTLHHIQPDALANALRQLSNLLWPGGQLFVIEDDPDEPVRTPTIFDRRLAELPAAGRSLLLRVNDYWANVVIYGRGHDDQVHGFRDTHGWLELLRRCGFSEIAHGRMGFNLKRLHGVPSCAMLMRVTEPASLTREGSYGSGPAAGGSSALGPRPPAPANRAHSA